MKRAILAASTVVVLAGCAAGQMFGPAPKDGELAIPSNYTSWPVFMAGIEKSSGHIRDIYVSNEGAAAKKGEAFADGTRFVMDIYKASKDSSGKMVKGELQKVFVMYKGKGWGESAPEGMKNGDWVYSAFNSAGQPLKVDYGTCRGCHLPLADKDYVFHYDKYFDMKASAGAPSYAEMMEAHAGMVALNDAEAGQAVSILK